MASVALGGCGDVARPRTAAGLQSLGVRLKDFPAGATADTARFWSNTAAAKRDHIAASIYRTHGRIRSYQSSFFRLAINGLAPSWMERADSEITEFAGQAGARWYFARLRSMMRHASVEAAAASATLSPKSSTRSFRYRSLPVAAVGSAIAGFTVDAPSDEVMYTTRVIVMRTGRFVLFLRVVGDEGMIPFARVVTVARAVADRIRANGG